MTVLESTNEDRIHEHWGRAKNTDFFLFTLDPFHFLPSSPTLLQTQIPRPSHHHPFSSSNFKFNFKFISSTCKLISLTLICTQHTSNFQSQ
ncbi:hypothetical protein LR48_Vigan569s000800 [Vigna angularis]|uniref:Uncharacterized protein n=1 Tax=Phaseolus angularis TaxID=3914 RepID=A0A0L9TDZ5_PHAAN|nr:hypothetical protein LR48_Vigan569s000800 [Vigna angularis]